MLSRFLSLICITTIYLGAQLPVMASAGKTRPITDEALRIEALRSIFPGMQVSPQRSSNEVRTSVNQTSTGVFDFPDALANEKVYRVVGPAANFAEQCAAEDVVARTSSTMRLLRFQLYQWPNERDAGLLAVLQYSFENAQPALSCPSLGILVHLVKDAAKWRVRDRYLLNASHHNSLDRVQLLDLTGDGADELVVESDSGAAGAAGSRIYIFGLASGHFQEFLIANSRLEYMTEERYAQALDIKRTLLSLGQQFCFTKTSVAENGTVFRSPRLTRPCYPRNGSDDKDEKEYQDTMLAPPTSH